MSIFSSIIVVIILGILYAFLKYKREKGKNRPVDQQQKDTRRSTKYHSVSLKFSADSCKAAMDMQGQRFLSNDVPWLPLPECDTPNECKCKFMHHKDRRTIEPRRSPYQHQHYFGIDDQGQLKEDKRKNKERRKN